MQFGVFEVDLQQGELRKHGHKIKLQERPFQFLAALLERPGQVVTRDELVRKLWSDARVDYDNGLNIAAKKVRDALDDNAATPRYVETLPRRGYRFIAQVQARLPDFVEEAALSEPALASKPEPSQPPIAPQRRHWVLQAVVIGFVLFLSARLYWLFTSVHPARLLRVVQLTQTGRADVSNGIATDGSRVYFTERAGGLWSVAQVSVEGGNPLPLAPQLPNPEILDISPDHSSLLLSSAVEVYGDRPLWLQPTVGGAPRRLGDVIGHAGTWSPDGSRIVFARGSALFRVASDGTDFHKLLDAPGIPVSLRWGPVRGREVLRFSVIDAGSKPHSLWQAAPDGRGLHRLVPRWEPGAGTTDGDDGGAWASNGKYYLFRSLRGSVASVWAMRENRTFPRASEGPPVQIYSTPMEFVMLAPNPDGKRIFFAAGQERRELARYDGGHHQFLPFLPGVDGRSANVSADGRWVTYVTVPDDTLWRSRPDGGDRLQLTPPSMHAFQPRWSPDGSRIAFSGGAGAQSKIYVIPSAGGALECLTSAPFAEADPDWSPDGTSLLLGRLAPAGTSGQAGLYVLEWKTRKSLRLAGSEDLSRPAWSPDARYIAATNRSGTQIQLWDSRSRQWTPLAAGAGLGPPFWSRDSRYIFYQEVLGGVEQPIFRVAISSRKVERRMSSRQIPQSNLAGYVLTGLAPDDAPIASVIHNFSDIYALEVELP